MVAKFLFPTTRLTNIQRVIEEIMLMFDVCFQMFNTTGQEITSPTWWRRIVAQWSPLMATSTSHIWTWSTMESTAATSWALSPVSARTDPSSTWMWFPTVSVWGLVGWVGWGWVPSSASGVSYYWLLCVMYHFSHSWLVLSFQYFPQEWNWS